MNEISGFLGIPIFLLVSSWGMFRFVLDVIDRLNKIRDFCLGYSEESKGFPASIRYRIFMNDWVPLAFGLLVATFVFAAVFFMMPSLFAAANATGSLAANAWFTALQGPSFIPACTHLELASYGIGALGIFSGTAHGFFAVFDYLVIKKTINCQHQAELSSVPSKPKYPLKVSRFAAVYSRSRKYINKSIR